MAPTYKMMVEVWRDMVDTLQPVTRRSSVQEHRIELATGGVIEMWSLDAPDSIRGRHYQRVVCDEVAIVPGFEDTWNKVIRPTLMDLHGDAWFLSTPKGMNWFWRAFQWGQEAGQQEWKSWKLPTSSNPYIAPTEIEAMRLTMPELVFSQEI